jgi:hypothetical protein
MFDFRFRATAKIRLTLHLLFPILIVGQIYFCGLRHRFSKERYDFPINDLVEAEPTNTFAEAVGGDSISEPIEGTRNVVGMNLIVSVIGVRPIFQTIHRIGELAQLGVSDCEFDFI